VQPSDVKKFGEAYQHYMQRVPRMNIIQGIIGKVGSRAVAEESGA
jgi:hypothetical protein